METHPKNCVRRLKTVEHVKQENLETFKRDKHSSRNGRKRGIEHKM